MKSLVKFLQKFFINYCWIGIILILLSIILKYELEENIYSKLIIDFLNTVGISILVASIFTWASETYSFIDKIQNLLRSVVVKRDFLSNLDSESKVDALKSLIKPSDFERNVYTNIDEYYDFYIKRTLSISEKNIRSDYTINARIYFDSTKNLLACDRTVNYRLYPTNKGYENIRIGFTNISATGEIKYVKIFKSDGEFKEKKGDEIIITETINDDLKDICTEIDMSEYSSVDKHLIIEFKTLEFGHDHWITLGIQTLQPTDGIVYRIACDDGIKVVDFDTYGQGVNFHVEKEDGGSSISIATYQWLNEGVGISVVASKK